MSVDTKTEALRLLNEYKWGDKFICPKCSNTSFKPRPNFGRQCRKCPYEETIYGNTALYNCRIQPEKIIGVLTYLVDNVKVDFEKKVIPVKLGENGRVFHANGDTGVNISLNELGKMENDGDVGPDTKRVLVENYVSESRLIQADVAKLFTVNVNSLHMLFEKISKRIAFFHEDMQGLESISVINSFFGSGRYDLNYVLGMLMVPIDDTWITNEKKINGKWYTIGPPSRSDIERTRWGIRNVIFNQKGPDGVRRAYYSKEDEPEYPVEG